MSIWDACPSISGAQFTRGPQANVLFLARPTNKLLETSAEHILNSPSLQTEVLGLGCVWACLTGSVREESPSAKWQPAEESISIVLSLVTSIFVSRIVLSYSHVLQASPHYFVTALTERKANSVHRFL